ncbi:Protein N-acetyltransferase, RimJ/RimL family [Arboricoccus pini]|uniref:Protein N-acetyltransferase, RimJ/RimL family n=1 Tax=Arboricoccus pini TaxID=1963835 RepID=A0A212QPU4_9PROT|nr:Protein N-acetyltransferase, RimJ/RimL family [Arboricoccus pini]
MTRYLLGPIGADASDAIIERIEAGFEKNGFGFWAVDYVGVAPLIGMVGISYPGFTAHFTPCVEIGWRLARRYWRQGLASEAARAALAFGFNELGLSEIVAFTAALNEPSQGLMRHLGMRRDPKDDFAMPMVPEGHPLRPHRLFRLANPSIHEDG